MNRRVWSVMLALGALAAVPACKKKAPPAPAGLTSENAEAFVAAVRKMSPLGEKYVHCMMVKMKAKVEGGAIKPEEVRAYTANPGVAGPVQSVLTDPANVAECTAEAK